MVIFELVVLVEPISAIEVVGSAVGVAVAV